jgi:hypothetical protein
MTAWNSFVKFLFRFVGKPLQNSSLARIQAMPMTDKDQSGEPSDSDSFPSPVSKDERLTALVSAYLDGELAGKEFDEFEALLRDNLNLAREVAEMRQIELQLTKIGADILQEPIPVAMLEALSPLARK